MICLDQSSTGQLSLSFSSNMCYQNRRRTGNDDPQAFSLEHGTTESGLVGPTQDYPTLPRGTDLVSDAHVSQASSFVSPRESSRTASQDAGNSNDTQEASCGYDLS